MSNLIYLDNAATTQPAPEAVAAMTMALTRQYFNPSALYAAGYEARKAMEAFRASLASRLGARQVVFTSGGTEANNLAIRGLLQNARKPGRVLLSAVEHPSVAQACHSLRARHEVLPLPVDAQGLLDLDAASRLMTSDTLLICLMQVNNEVGAIQPVEALVRLRDQLCPDALLHVDGVQGFLRLPLLLGGGIDSCTLSAHKVHGPKGVGALALGARARLQPQILGGQQEEGLRAGTENTAGIAGFEAAVKAWPSARQTRQMKVRLYEGLLRRLPDLVLNGPEPQGDQAVEHILNLSFPPLQGQTLMHALEARGVLVSQGSACAARSRKPSLTLQGMGVARKRQDSALRFSLSHQTTKEDIDTAVQACAEAYTELKPYTRR
ncbi:MAG: cysteine desulfurase [Clostridiales bacterium]|nr:cysteine desulfurase [Clostridiales bacterium]